jgi:hypothetical protein
MVVTRYEKERPIAERHPITAEDKLGLTRRVARLTIASDS